MTNLSIDPILAGLNLPSELLNNEQSLNQSAQVRRQADKQPENTVLNPTDRVDLSNAMLEDSQEVALLLEQTAQNILYDQRAALSAHNGLDPERVARLLSMEL